MDLIYTGRHGAVSVPCPDGSEPVVQWGDTFTTTDEHAQSLLDQPDNWRPASKAAKRSKADSEGGS